MSGGAPDYRMSFDIGGTFTDLVILDGGTGTLRVTKVPTVPQNPAEAVARGVRRLLEMQGIAAGAIGYAVAGATTLVTNTLIEGKGARTGLITTLGFADVLEIGREIRYDVYENSPKMPPPLVPRPLRKEVGERLDIGLRRGRIGETRAHADGVLRRQREVPARARGQAGEDVALELARTHRGRDLDLLARPRA